MSARNRPRNPSAGSSPTHLRIELHDERKERHVQRRADDAEQDDNVSARAELASPDSLAGLDGSSGGRLGAMGIWREVY